MAQRKPYNPNTAYGRKKLREQAAEYRANLPEAERRSHDATGIILFIIIMAVILTIIYLVGGRHAVERYLQR